MGDRGVLKLFHRAGKAGPAADDHALVQPGEEVSVLMAVGTRLPLEPESLYLFVVREDLSSDGELSLILTKVAEREAPEMVAFDGSQVLLSL